MSAPEAAVLLAGFGGPESPAEIVPFLESVLSGARVAPGRLEAVAHHYHEVGGRSPYNGVVESQRAAIERWLAGKNRPLPVFAAFRHAKPSFEEAFRRIAATGTKKVLLFPISPLRSRASFGKYEDAAREGMAKAGLSLEIETLPAFHEDPRFIRAQADRAAETLAAAPDARVHALFTAHSIPLSMDAESGYSSQFERIAYLVAEALSLGSWGIAYQSRSGRPEDPWLAPDPSEAIGKIDRAKIDAVLLVPAGFVCDNVEILYDLDVEARAAADAAGLRYLRAGTAGDHPSFVEMIGRQALWRLDSCASR